MYIVNFKLKSLIYNTIAIKGKKKKKVDKDQFMHIERSGELEENENQLVLLESWKFISNISHSKFILCFQIFFFVLARITSVTYYNNVIYIFWLGMRFVIIYKVSIIKIFVWLFWNSQSFSLKGTLLCFNNMYIFIYLPSASTSPQICIFSFLVFLIIFFFFFFAKRKFYTFFQIILWWFYE